MQTWEESLGTGTSRRNSRDFDDFDELDDGELAPTKKTSLRSGTWKMPTRTRMNRRKCPPGLPPVTNEC